MKESYKFINGKIIAYDNNNGIIEYDYQDNIEEVLNQENVVEQLSNDIEELRKEESQLEMRKNSFLHLFFSDGFGENVIFCFGIGALIAFVNIGISYGLNLGSEMFNIICRILSASCILSTIPVGIYGYKKTKLVAEAKVENVKAQIREFEEVLKKELKKLTTLKQTKIKTVSEETLTHETKKIDNSEIEAISDITKKKQLYKFFREYILKLNKYNTKQNLKEEYEKEFSDEDVAFIDAMASNNKALTKSRKRTN